MPGLVPPDHPGDHLRIQLDPRLYRHGADGRPLVAVQLAPIEAAGALHAGPGCPESRRKGTSRIVR
jgi:hypothetical protein